MLLQLNPFVTEVVLDTKKQLYVFAQAFQDAPNEDDDEVGKTVLYTSSIIMYCS